MILLDTTSWCIFTIRLTWNHSRLRLTCHTSFTPWTSFHSTKNLIWNGPPPTNSEDWKTPKLRFLKYFGTRLKIKYSILIIINIVTITMIHRWTWLQIDKKVHPSQRTVNQNQHFWKKIPLQNGSDNLRTTTCVGRRGNVKKMWHSNTERVCATIHGKSGRLLGFATRSSSLPFSLRFRQLISPLYPRSGSATI